jgi:sorbitol/mannitol transport system permease protein
MPTPHLRSLARLMIAPSVTVLFTWMLLPLALTVYFSTLRYNLLAPGATAFAGVQNYSYFLSDPAFRTAIANTLVLVGGVLLVTVIGGVLLALLLEQPMWGRAPVRLLVLAPFFVMPTVSALVWKNMFLNPVNGLFAHLASALGLQPYDALANAPLAAIVGILSWQWLPFATLILLTALQSVDRDQLEAADMDGAGALARVRFIVLPHLARPIAVVILMETVFLLSVFAEILVTTNGGPGVASTNLTYLVYAETLLRFDVGTGSAGAVVAIVLANIVAIFLVRMIGRNLEP